MSTFQDDGDFLSPKPTYPESLHNRIRPWIVGVKMVRAFYISGVREGKRLSMEQVEILTGALYCQVDLNNLESTFQQIRKVTGYISDQVLHFSVQTFGADYENIVKDSQKEHMHLEPEIRCITEGTLGYDLRDQEDEWIQIILSPGDLLIIPSGVYHRISLFDNAPDVKVIRLFKHRHTWRNFLRPELLQEFNFRTR